MANSTERSIVGLRCTHCGDACTDGRISAGEKYFCCEGCRTVWRILDQNGLCRYYDLNEHPGQSRRSPVRDDKFAFLDDDKLAEGLIRFRNEEETHVRFYLPAMHCSSCLYLLENLRRLEPGLLSSRVDFAAREIFLVFDHHRVSLRSVAELLTSIGYEPYVSLHDLGRERPRTNRRLIYRLGVAGCCFGNIMLLCFPEYLGLSREDGMLRQAFRYLSLLLSLPVFLYCSQPFYASAWKGIRHRYLNIDAPIALAIGVSFFRSAWEVLSGTGPGYFDSMSGIVFFMLAGRVLQDRTYRQLSFERDYTAWFPVAVSVVQRDGKMVLRSLRDIRCGDVLCIHSGELIPADGILTLGHGCIDYSFVTGESMPVAKAVGELVYAGGRQTGAAIELLVMKEVAQSWLTQLWNRTSGSTGERPASSFVNILSRHFATIVLAIAAGAMIYWVRVDPSNMWRAVTAVLIVACPCALYLSGTFTNGNLLRLLGRNGLFLRNAEVITVLASATHIVFDKTGTLTDNQDPILDYSGTVLTPLQQEAIASLVGQSMHPLSQVLARTLGQRSSNLELHDYNEHPGRGLSALVAGDQWTIGSAAFTGARTMTGDSRGSRIFVACNNRVLGCFTISTRYRKDMAQLFRQLAGRFRATILSGDSGQEAGRLREIAGMAVPVFFGKSPQDKAGYIAGLQAKGEKVIMVGDGLNDAGALRQSDAGIAVSADANNFTPACDAMIQADRLGRLPQFIRLCRAGRNIILASFGLSVVYNIVGLSFAVRATLSPLLAAILMPASSLSILLVTCGASNVLGKRWLREKPEQDHPA